MKQEDKLWKNNKSLFFESLKNTIAYGGQAALTDMGKQAADKYNSRMIAALCKTICSCSQAKQCCTRLSAAAGKGNCIVREFLLKHAKIAALCKTICSSTRMWLHCARLSAEAGKGSCTAWDYLLKHGRIRVLCGTVC
jgi:hypothetical protein